LELERPDVIPPEQAVFNDVFVTDTNVLLHWYPSTSDDVKMQILFRKMKEENHWQALDTFAIQTASFTDNQVEIKMNYEYTIVTIDESGLKSDHAFPVMARPYDTGKRKPVENFTAVYELLDKNVILTWDYTPLEDERLWYVIYRASEDGTFKEHKSVNGSTFSFVDSRPKKGEVSYGIVVMTSHGGESEMITTSLTIE